MQTRYFEFMWYRFTRQGRIKACMKEHIRELSEPCKEALFQAWLRE